MTKHETSKPSQAAPGEIKEAPSGYRPWEDSTLPPEERFEAYKAHVQEQVLALGRAAEKLGTLEELWEFTESPETQRLFAHAEELSEMTAGEYCRRLDRLHEIRQLLGKNFLGAEEWRAQGIDVGAIPMIPGSITQDLLDSDCPLHPGEKIKDTHVLVLIPKTVNGEPYSALKLDELCATRKGSSDKLIYDGTYWATDWKERDWAKAPQAQSEWVLIPKSDPGPERMREKYGEMEGDKRHFREKDIATQQEVHNDHYKEYREVKALEVMTMALLYDLTHKERLLPVHLQCEEPNAFGGRVCVGYFKANGLEVVNGAADSANDILGLALARKL